MLSNVEFKLKEGGLQNPKLKNSDLKVTYTHLKNGS